MHAAQVERPVAQARELVDRALLVDRERRRVGLGEQLEVGDRELDLAGREVGVDVVGLATRDRPDRGDHVLGRAGRGRARAPRARSPGGRRAAEGPERSRRSMKIRPPWSRRRCTQPATRISSPARAASTVPDQVSR